MALTLATCAHQGVPARPSAPPLPIRITLVATNDLHGWVQPHESRLPDGTSLRAGGVALFASYMDILRAENPGGVVLVDAGDLFQGTLVANISEGESVIAGYNALGYDAAALGNHEFDYGPVGPRSAALRAEDDPLGALAARAAQAGFPLLARNVRGPDGQPPAFLAAGGAAIVERGGLKVGLLGLLTPLTPQVTNPVNVSRLRFAQLLEEAKSGAAELRQAGADLVVAIVHAGGRCGDLSDPRQLQSCDLNGEIFELLGALPAGHFDAVVAGHTHAQVGHFVNGMPLVESGSYGLQFGVVELAVSPRTRRPIPEQTRIRAAIPICERLISQTGDCNAKRWKPGMELVEASFDGQPIRPSSKLEEILAPYLDRVREKQLESLSVTLPASISRESRAESPLGDALADALRAMEGADFALLNSGGFRADLREGLLTYGALYEVLPFDNAVASLTVTGQEIIDLLEALLSGSHGVPQTSGLRFAAEVCGRGARITEIALSDGRALDRDASYRLATSDFLALGGDGLGAVLDRIPASRKDFGQERETNMRDGLAAWFRQRGGTLEAKVDGRMRITVAGGAECQPR